MPRPIEICGMVFLAAFVVWLMVRHRRGRAPETRYPPFRRWQWKELPPDGVEHMALCAAIGGMFAALAIFLCLTGVVVFTAFAAGMALYAGAIATRIAVRAWRQPGDAVKRRQAAILAIAVALAVLLPAWGILLVRGRAQARLLCSISNAHSLVFTASVYAREHGGEWPDGIEVLFRDGFFEEANRDLLVNPRPAAGCPSA